MKNQSIAILISALSLSSAAFAQNDGVRESTDPQKIAAVEQHAQMLAQAQTDTAKGASGDSGTTGSTASPPHSKKKKMHAKSKNSAHSASGAPAAGSGSSGASSSGASSSPGNALPPGAGGSGSMTPK